MSRRIIEIDKRDYDSVIESHGLIKLSSSERDSLMDAFKRSTVIDDDYKRPPRTQGLVEALEKVKEREKWEAQLASRSNDSDKHIYASILLQDVANQIEKIIEIDCAKENKRAFAKWAKKHSNDS